MSQYQDGPHRTFESGADLSAEAHQYRFVKRSSATAVVRAAAASDEIVGVLYNRPVSGQNADVRLKNAQGSSLVKLGGTVTDGQYVTSNADGDAVYVGGSPAAGVNSPGFVLGGGVAGDIVEMIHDPRRY